MPHPRALSWTSLRTYERCPLRFKLKHLDRAPPEAEAPAPVALGRALHAALEAYHRRGAPSRADAERALRASGLEADAHEGARALLREWARREARIARRVLAVERPFRVDLAGVPFEGVIDRVDAAPGGRAVIVDYKSGANVHYARREAAKGAQLGYYQLGAEHALGFDVDHVAIEHLRSGLRFTGDRRDVGTLDALVARAHDAWDAMGAGAFPARAGPECPCEYARRCPLWSDLYPKIEDWTGEARARIAEAVARFAATRDPEARAQIESHFREAGVARAWGTSFVAERDASGALRVRDRPSVDALPGTHKAF